MNKITVQTTVHITKEKVWEYWNLPKHITQWAFASDDWEAPFAKNELKIGGTFKTRMQSKTDPTQGFDFTGTYTNVLENELIEYDMDPEEGKKPRQVTIVFETTPEGTKITETFDPEHENSEELQKQGWQAILDNFKKYAQSHT